MLIKMVNGQIYMKDLDEVQASVIRSWPGFRSIRAAGLTQGPANLDALDRLAKMVRLPAYIEEERQRLTAVQAAVDRERTAETPEPLFRYPVTKKLYAHQVRASNMALLVFGLVPPERSRS